MTSNRLFRVLVLASMLLGVAFSAVQHPAQAAYPCIAYHIVKTGDTTITISQTYGLKWRDIATANNLDDDYRLKVGDRLCIPPTGYVPPVVPSFKLQATSIKGIVTITVSGIKTKSSYYVRVRDGMATYGGFTKLGILRAAKNLTTVRTFRLPKTLLSKLYIQVCLKNGTTNELVCQTVINQP